MSDTERLSARPRRDDTQGTTADGFVPGLVGWVESRSGLGAAARATFNPQVPSVARFRYALGASLVSALAIEVCTGLLMMFSYCPASSAAWGSTFYLDSVLTGGWFLRGLHHFAAHAMVIVAMLHLLSAVVAGAYRAPRELNWWLGLALLGMIVAFTLSGNALVWDQDGYWAWNVETSIAGSTPLVGPIIQRLIVGGSEPGNGTLGRLYALHVGLLPILVLIALGGHVVLARRHALNRPEGGRGVGVVEPAWPKQVFRNMLASALLLGIVSVLVVAQGGAALDAPADPASEYPARPAWFFFWLFELRKSFPGPLELIATMVVPGAIAVVMLLLPFFDRVFPRKLAHFLACAFAFAVLGGASYLTVRSIQADAADPHYREALAKSDSARDRAVVLARLGVPPEGAAVLLTQDPLYHGRGVLDAKCLGCHAFGGSIGGKQTAPDLQDFGSRAWVRDLLENPGSRRFFGKVSGAGGMAEWKKTSKLSPKQLDDVADFVATFATVPDDATAEEWLNLPGVAEHAGAAPFQKECGTCHVVEGLTEGGARDSPQLFGWGSPRWTARVIRKPWVADMYGYLDKPDQMPPFADQLTGNDVKTVVRYLLNDYPGAPTRPAR